jgi:hypothetical protein
MTRHSLAVLVLFISFAMLLAGHATVQYNRQGPIGDWRGDFICQVRESACHDEDSLYHVTRLAEKPGWFSMKLDKIVDGKPVTMGTVDCSYEAQQHLLECSFPRGVLRFTVEEDKMEGAMTLTDKTLWRKISLKKVRS